MQTIDKNRKIHGEVELPKWFPTGTYKVEIENGETEEELEIYIEGKEIERELSEDVEPEDFKGKGKGEVIE